MLVLMLPIYLVTIVIILVLMTGKIRLSDIETGRSVYIERVKGESAFRHRIGEMGFVKGKMITVVKNAPLNDPVEFSLMGYNVSLRRQEASLIEVSPGFDQELTSVTQSLPGIMEQIPGNSTSHTIRVALVGNPNAGKTTIFNFASGSREHVGNYTGVTISDKTASFKLDNYTFQLTDLPGTYSLSAYSPEELFVRDFILEQKPDVVINIVDATNLERNLYLTSQLIDMNVRVVVALNMFDELLKNKDSLDYAALGSLLGIPFVPTIGARGKGIHKLFRKVIEVYTGKNPIQRNIRINYGTEVELGVEKIRKKIALAAGSNEINGVPIRFIALRLLNKDRLIESFILNFSRYSEIMNIAREESGRIELLMNDSVESVITAARYGFIYGALKETLKADPHTKMKNSDRIDYLLTHKFLGFPIFLLFLWIMFTVTFTLGAYPQDWIDKGVGLLGNMFNGIMPEGSLKQLISEGIIGGVGGVIVFLPNILILFFFISLMEDTGYMARAAFITDKLMHKIGLHGKSFIPLVMGFGCNVPAIMSTRTIESKNNRLLTMLINPFMSCSARLPVYLLLIGAVFPEHRGSLLFGIYLVGIIMAILVALVFKNTFFKSSDAPFVMELPPYRMPTARSTIRHMWSKASQYLRKMGGIIMIASILIWALGHYPLKVRYSTDYVAKKAEAGSAYRSKTAGIHDQATLLSLQKEYDHNLRMLDANMKAEHQERSYIGRIGKSIEPVITPLGFDWKMGICLLTGVAAKEIVVSTMGVIYQADEGNDYSNSLQGKIKGAVYTRGPHLGKPVYTPLATFSFILFTLLYFPCIATVAAIYKESGSWKWAGFSVLYTTGLAWVVSLVFYQTGMLF
jgi:ferrous iron transport protein B